MGEEAPVSSRPADPLEDLEALALRVVGLEAEAVAAHALAQRLNKEGSFAGTSMMSPGGRAYAALYRLPSSPLPHPHPPLSP